MPESKAGVSRSEATGWAGWQLFAAIMLIMVGVFVGFLGFVALFRTGIFVVHRDEQLIPISYTTWGWIHILIATIAIVTGIGLFLGQMWARIAGVVLAVVNVLVMFAFLGSYPWLATMVIAYSVVTVYAITVHGREVAEAYDR